MFEILPESTDTCIGFKVSGKVSSEDYDVLLDKVDKAIAEHGKINLVAVFGDFSGYADLEAAKSDWKFGTHQYRQVNKAAFVGDKKWQEWVVKLMAPFTRAEERFFAPEEIDDAWEWASGQDE